MLDHTALKAAIDDLKQNFSQHWSEEKYKWEAIKWFQDNWDIDAPDFSAMFAKATEKTYNLLQSGLFYPRAAITNWSKKDPELFRKMFKDLYDESKDLFARVKDFTTSAAKFHAELKDGVNHFQNTNAISVYLWLKYPDKYYIYRYSEARAIAIALKYPEVPKKSSEPGEMIKAFKMYDEMKETIKKDSELINLVKSSLTDICYPDPELVTLTGDVGFYISKSMKSDEENEKVQYWILGAGEGAYLWNEFYKDGIAAIGWDTGDLRNYNSKEEVKKKLKESRNTDKNPRNDGRALWDFLQEMHIGDVVFVKRGSHEFVGRGIVKSDYRYEKDRSYQHIRDMEWTNNETHEYNDGKAAIKTLTNITRYPEYCQELEKLFSKNETQGFKMQKNHSLNQILYGPPGTGKTYNTVIQSVAIIEDKDVKDVASENYEDVYNRFRSYRSEKQIDFITFHQSYSYEEFVEGIKPDEPEGDDAGMTYSCQPGIFKDICTRAETKGNFEECYKRFIDDISETERFKLKTPTNKDFAVSVRQNGNLKFYTGKDQNKAGSITKEKLRNACAGVWPDYYKGYYQGVINELKSKYGLKQGDVEKPYVLIIDEINRGNISKIFGELITLIEEDKRERLYAQLPYSKDQFTVPHNLSIVGTMNTADRSIAAIDIALRRRFKFVAMMPNSDLVKDVTIDGVNLKELMDGLNRRISVLIDRDHQIGHAYFMHINTLSELKDAWFNKILPLLNEYFYGDWNKLKLVVKTFIDEENIPEDLKEEYGDEKLYSFKSETAETDDKFISDLKGLFTK